MSEWFDFGIRIFDFGFADKQEKAGSGKVKAIKSFGR